MQQEVVEVGMSGGKSFGIENRGKHRKGIMLCLRGTFNLDKHIEINSEFSPQPAVGSPQSAIITTC